MKFDSYTQHGMSCTCRYYSMCNFRVQRSSPRHVNIFKFWELCYFQPPPPPPPPPTLSGFSCNHMAMIMSLWLPSYSPCAGSYVMIISEVTSPKYFGHIEDLYVEVTVASHKIGPHSSSIDRLLQANRKSRASITPIPEPGGEKVPRSKSKLLTQNKM